MATTLHPSRVASTSTENYETRATHTARVAGNRYLSTFKVNGKDCAAERTVDWRGWFIDNPDKTFTAGGFTELVLDMTAADSARLFAGRDVHGMTAEDWTDATKPADRCLHNGCTNKRQRNSYVCAAHDSHRRQPVRKWCRHCGTELPEDIGTIGNRNCPGCGTYISPSVFGAVVYASEVTGYGDPPATAGDPDPTAPQPSGEHSP